MYLICAFFAVFSSFLLFRRAVGCMSIQRLNMMSWIFYMDFILYSVIGAILVVYKIDHHYVIDKLMFESSRTFGFFAILYAIVFFPVGMLFANFVFNIKDIKNKFLTYLRKPIEKERKYNDCNVRFFLILLSIICVLSVMYVLYTLGTIPIVRLLIDKGTFDTSLFRGGISSEFSGMGLYIKNIFALGLTPLLSYMAYGYKKLSNTRQNKIWFYIMFLASICIVTHNYEKSPLIIYFLGFLFYKVYTCGKLPKKFILFCILFVLSLLIGMYWILNVEMGIDIIELFSYNRGIVGRIILSQCGGTFMTLDLFPSVIDHLGFSSVSSLWASLFNLEYSETSARLIMGELFPGAVMEGTAGVMNSLFIAEAWANFGWYGLIISPIYVGFIIQSLFLFFLKSPKTPFFLAFFVYYSARSSLTGGFNAYIYNPQVLLFLGLIILIYGMVRLMDYRRYVGLMYENGK